MHKFDDDGNLPLDKLACAGQIMLLVRCVLPLGLRHPGGAQADAQSGSSPSRPLGPFRGLLHASADRLRESAEA
ncbi:hypothetical protein LJR290_001073 [Variovorax sp. LjRoot290]|uniref:hypothetical protein n=1 Tax=unclassified Variovorax TaxID=663243 RepID=UPI003ECC2A35